MSAGELRHKVVIESLTHGATTNGDYSEPTWATVATVWASIRPSKAGEQSGDRDFTRQSIDIKIRYRSDVTNKMRITEGSTIYEINSIVDPIGRGQYLLISATVHGA